jgi:uncharacterized protein
MQISSRHLNGIKKVYYHESLKNINTLSTLLLIAAEAGHKSAQYNLGFMFQYGKGVEANIVKALEWYQKGMLSWVLQNININILSVLLSAAAEAGHSKAQYNLGVIFQNGEGVKINLVKALEWYQKGILSYIL